MENDLQKNSELMFGEKEGEQNRRQSLPLYTLTEMTAFCAKIYMELGKGDYHSKELICNVHNTTYNNIKQKLSTAQEYGLLEMRYKLGYKLTSLFFKVYKPEHEEEKKLGMIECLRTSELYSKLLDEFEGHPLPSEQSLANRLIRSFHIKDYIATKAAQIFIANLHENYLLTSDGLVRVLAKQPPPGPSTIVSSPKKEENPYQPQLNLPPAVTDEPVQVSLQRSREVEYIEIPVPLKSGRRAFIKIPEDYKPEDCDRIAKFVEALK